MRKFAKFAAHRAREPIDPAQRISHIASGYDPWLHELFKAGVAMKLFVGVAVFVWLLCGVIGAWRMDDLDAGHWKTIAKGPITLVKAFNEHPVTFSGP